ncbi:MAG: threonine synthase [Rhodothermales bacterium]|nr:threonine synthase [Rhodothermales bacterium]MBO6781548.1 threonine synthase [Rhodothermales bacterium]
MALRFRSTRSDSPATTGFIEALHRGLAPDGGLYVPETISPLPQGWTTGESVADIGCTVLGSWLDGELPGDALEAAVRDALNFPVQLVSLGGDWTGVHVLELFHGPTLSFKDFGARTMSRLMAASLPEGREITILVATSGDTGSAVADGFSGLPGVRVVLLYPEGQVSPIQERQLVVKRPGVTSLKVRGTFDDCQRLVKGAFADEGLRHVGLSSANSINIGRLLPQSLYYLWAVSRLGEAEICVPSGNLGNLTAAVLAWKAGMPVRGFIAAHNNNRFFPDYLTGDEVEFRPSVRTMSNAMDVGAPSNFERLEHMLGPQTMRSAIRGFSVDEAGTAASMRRLYEETGYLADPHTAVGIEAVRQLRPDRPVVVASTAHPCKFPEAVEPATGVRPEMPDRLAALWDEPVAARAMEVSGEALREVILGA